MVDDGWHRLRAFALARTTAPWIDLALGGIFLAAVLGERFLVSPVSLAPAPAVMALGIALVLAVAVALRRRMPLTAYLLNSVALAVGALTLPPSELAPYANLVGAYSVGLYATRRRAWWGLAVMVGCVVVYFGAGADRGNPVEVLGLWLAAWAIGYSNARRRQEQAAARRLVRQQAVTDEQARIARELHDLIGHTVNLMLMQAGAGRRVLDRDPAKARELLVGLEHAGRDALTELDRVLGVLRADDPDDELSGAPGLAALPELAQRMTQAGLRVGVRVDPDLPPLPRSLEMSAYRIVQECLTNAFKHGEARVASVTVRHHDQALDLEVRNDGQGPRPGYLPGRGLLGIGERVALFGGSVEHGRGERGGFRVRARLPLLADRLPGGAELGDPAGGIAG